jgi:hypothetical protein
MSDRKDESTAGGVAGFQIPLGIKVRKKKVDELLQLHEDLNEGHALSYLSSLTEADAEAVGQKLDACEYNDVAEAMRHHMVRELVRRKVREVVRKKAGGGGYVLYSPNQGKKKPPKSVGEFPTKLGAKRAELARFPPKDPGKLKRLRREVDKLAKDPKKAAEKETQARKEKGTDTGKRKAELRKEGVELLRATVRALIRESLFREERTGSDWDEYIGRMSGKTLQGDKKFQSLQKNIEKRTESVLADAMKSIKKAVGKSVKLKDFGLKKSDDGKTYTAFAATMGQVEVGPIYIYVENGVPKIEVSDQAKAALTKTDPAEAKLFRAELVTVQERVLDRVDALTKAIESRDKYLTKVEQEVDSFVAGLTPLQVSLLKQLLVKKYRGTK